MTNDYQNDRPNEHRARALPLIALGIALFAIGLTGHRSLFWVGLAFWVAGILLLRPGCRPRR
ncbi:MAG TPA: hypothetical protein VNZ44_20275 [Pyrinomonadaceae bacterium]|nr:hypothetical protein [Pyrinomonadaceae bacterium]